MDFPLIHYAHVLADKYTFVESLTKDILCVHDLVPRTRRFLVGHPCLSTMYPMEWVNCQRFIPSFILEDILRCLPIRTLRFVQMVCAKDIAEHDIDMARLFISEAARRGNDDAFFSEVNTYSPRSLDLVDAYGGSDTILEYFMRGPFGLFEKLRAALRAGSIQWATIYNAEILRSSDVSLDDWYEIQQDAIRGNSVECLRLITPQISSFGPEDIRMVLEQNNPNMLRMILFETGSRCSAFDLTYIMPSMPDNPVLLNILMQAWDVDNSANLLQSVIKSGLLQCTRFLLLDTDTFATELDDITDYIRHARIFCAFEDRWSNADISRSTIMTADDIADFIVWYREDIPNRFPIFFNLLQNASGEEEDPEFARLRSVVFHELHVDRE